MTTSEEKIANAVRILAEGGKLVVAVNVAESLPEQETTIATLWPPGVDVVVAPWLPPGTIVAVAAPPSPLKHEVPFT